MRISLRLIPILLLFVFYGLLQLSFTQLRKMQEAADKKETRAILEIVTDRFKRYLELPFTIGDLGQEFLSADIRHTNYEKYAGIVKNSNPEFLGFNVLDENGVIIRTFPDGKNAVAKGRRSQMLGPLLESLDRGEPFYFSQPFRLFQGQQGFVFYFPVRKAAKLQGWYAIVISSETFLEKFALADFLKVFHLVIIDELSGLDYFATSMVPKDEKVKIFSNHAMFYGRKIAFKTWRREETPIQTFPWYFSVILSLIFAGAADIMLRLYEQRRRARGQLDNMGILLRVTSKEALSNLIDIHSEFNQLNLPEDEKVERLSRDINYLTNLIEQIDLLQTMAHTREGITDGNHNLLALIQEQLDQFADVIERKNVKVRLDGAALKEMNIRTNEWLFSNSVLSNIFSHLLIHIESDSELRIESQVRGQIQKIIFRIRRRPSPDHSIKLETRRMEVARKVLQLQNGDLREEHADNYSMQITLSLPR